MKFTSVKLLLAALAAAAAFTGAAHALDSDVAIGKNWRDNTTSTTVTKTVAWGKNWYPSAIKRA